MASKAKKINEKPAFDANAWSRQARQALVADAWGELELLASKIRAQTPMLTHDAYASEIPALWFATSQGANHCLQAL